MGQPICPATGIAFAFPDVCLTPGPVSPIPIPYPNIAQLADVTGEAADLLVGGMKVLVKGSKVPTSSGDEGGTAGGGVTSGTIKGEMEVTKGSATVLCGGKDVARFGDPTTQNKGNAVGTLLGAFPTVLVGG
jgi:uncharacterized Zn-binding protein involved in type VI secretion